MLERLRPVVYGMSVMAAFRVFLIALALTAPVWTLHATTVSACSCGFDGNTFAERLRAADIVVVGVITDVRVIDELPARTPQLLPDGSVEPEGFNDVEVESDFAVDDYLKGSGPSTLVIRSRTGVLRHGTGEVEIYEGTSPSCSRGLALSASYLVYRAEPLDDPLQTSACDVSIRLIENEEQLQEIRQLLQEPTPHPTVVDLPETGTGSVDPESSLAWQITAAAAGALLAVSASAALVTLRRRVS